MALKFGPNTVGEFQNTETKVWFTFSDRPVDKFTHSHGFTRHIHMCNGTTRDARIGKTVVYVAVDEDEYGQPVVEKWQIRNLSFYQK